MSSMEVDAVEPHVGLKEDKVEGCIIPMDIEPCMDKKSNKSQTPSGGELIVYKGDEDLEPREGMEFESEEAARIFYSSYASRVGFRIRISRYSRSRRDNSVISRRLVCSKEGFRELRVNKGLFGDQRQRQRAVTRVGCKAMIMVKKIGTGKWVVTKFVKEHNHGPVPPRKLDVVIAHDNNLSIDNSTISEGDAIQEPFEGMEFESEEAAKAYYSAYARKMGFRARISKYCRSRRDNSIISRQIVCSKEGFREIRVKKENEMDDEGKAKRSRMITRIGCKAMILVKKLNSGKWIVSRFEKEHNHALVGSDKALIDSDSNIGNQLLLEGADVVSTGTANGGYSSAVQGTSRESLTVLYNQLCCEAIRYAQEGAVNEEIYNVAMSALKEAVSKVAAAKRKGGTVTQSGPPVVQGIIEEIKPAASEKELLLLQQPVNFVLIPSTMPNDCSTSHSLETPLMANISNDQISHDPSYGMHKACSGRGVNNAYPVSVMQPSLTTSAVEGVVGNGLVGCGLSAGGKRDQQAINGNLCYKAAVQKSQKLDSVKESQSNATSTNGASLVHSETSEAPLLAIPALPVALYVPMMGSLPATCSVSAPGTAGGSYALVAAPFEALPVSSRTAEASENAHAIPQHVPSSQKGTLALTAAPLSNLSSQIEPYTGPNPEVRAAAIAAGARILPPKAAASLIKAVESRIRSEGACLSISTVGDSSPSAMMTRGPRACSTNLNKGAPELASGCSDSNTQSHKDCEGHTPDSKERKLHKHQEVSKESEGLLDDSAADEGLTMFGDNESSK